MYTRTHKFENAQCINYLNTSNSTTEKEHKIINFVFKLNKKNHNDNCNII